MGQLMLLLTYQYTPLHLFLLPSKVREVNNSKSIKIISPLLALIYLVIMDNNDLFIAVKMSYFLL